MTVSDSSSASPRRPGRGERDSAHVRPAASLDEPGAAVRRVRPHVRISAPARVRRNLGAVRCETGAALRAEDNLPDAEAPVPARARRTPYHLSFPLTPVAALDPERATEEGFALVVQDVRGQHGSDGEFDPFKSEGADGYDSVEWVAAQPWCDGAVGMTGRSYRGGHPVAGGGRAAAATCGRSSPVVVGSDYYHGWVYQGGAFQLGFNLFWVNLMTDPKARGLAAPRTTAHLPISEPPLLDREPGRPLLPRVARAPDLRSSTGAHSRCDQPLPRRARAGVRRGRLVRRLPRRHARELPADEGRGRLRRGARRHAPADRPVGTRKRLRRLPRPPLRRVRPRR